MTLLTSFPGLIDSHYSNQAELDDREWLIDAMAQINADFNRSADTHLYKIALGGLDGIQVYLKDEATHPTGSLKHRLARSLIFYGLCNGKIGPKTTLIEASSGSTAVSESYFARLLGLPFIAVVPHNTSVQKIEEIGRYGGRVHKVDPGKIYIEAARLEDETGGYYLDQFTNAERATDWRGNNNIAESLFQQMKYEKSPVPSWVVTGAGTGGTSTTIGRYVRYQVREYSKTQVCVADPENSVFFDCYKNDDHATVSNNQSRIEGVGRPRVEPSFVPQVIDRMLKISDEASIASVWWLHEMLGKRFGPSTGLNFYASLILAQEMKDDGKTGSIVSLICDSGERYEDTCYSHSWLSGNQLNIEPHLDRLNSFMSALID